MEQNWFELKDERKRFFNESVWIPLRASVSSRNDTKPWHSGYKEEFFGVGSVAIPLSKKEAGESLSWSNIGLINEQRSYAFEDSYKPADIYQNHDEVDFGVELVLKQSFHDVDGGDVWHLHQDLIMALGLLREGNVWISPNHGYTEVVRLTKNLEGQN